MRWNIIIIKFFFSPLAPFLQISFNFKETSTNTPVALSLETRRNEWMRREILPQAVKDNVIRDGVQYPYQRE